VLPVGAPGRIGEIGFAVGVVSELELVNVKWKVGFADFVEIYTNAAFIHRPEVLDVLSLN
jgi:hypothetical protein